MRMSEHQGECGQIQNMRGQCSPECLHVLHLPWVHSKVIFVRFYLLTGEEVVGSVLTCPSTHMLLANLLANVSWSICILAKCRNVELHIQVALMEGKEHINLSAVSFYGFNVFQYLETSFKAVIGAL